VKTNRSKTFAQSFVSIRPRKMKAVLVLLVALIVSVAAVELKAKCHPECRWQCDDPVCPAQCHPVCARPKCEMQCQETPCAQCTVHCEQPECSVRCPKDMCEKDDCAKCDTVCAPAECRTTCIAPEANCAPLCEETACNWSCAKPTTCPRPKCELQCEKPKCDINDEAQACCPCTGGNLIAAAELASAIGSTGDKMSLMELSHHMRAKETSGDAPMCCPCAAKS